jgi:NitT/TauT family transport system permease protein
MRLFSLSNSRRSLPNLWDAVGLILLLAVLIAIAHGSKGITAPLDQAPADAISLDIWALPYFALRTNLRMFAALVFSLLFTFTYATLAAKSRRAELVLIPLLDVLQSVPILGFLSFTVTFFLGLFPGSVLGAECAAVFAIFTSQAWNMAFSFYQSLTTVPKDLDEAARAFRLSPWQKFWRLETPFAMPGLIWNMMMSMSGGWFFIVASEAISVGDTTIKLPGIGSYIATAIEQQNVSAILAASLTMLIVILAYDQLLFRPIVAWGSKFRVELSAGQREDESWVLDIFNRSLWIKALLSPLGLLAHRFSTASVPLPSTADLPPRLARSLALITDIVFFVGLAAMLVWSGSLIYHFVSETLTLDDLTVIVINTIYTLVRVMALIILASAFWVPVSVWIGLRPRLAEKVQPIAQFLAAYPANVLFPIFVIMIVRFSLSPDIWLSFLVIFGTQWYIVFNVIAGTAAFPNDLKEVAANFRIKGWSWWKNVMLPGIFPYYFTGALTASGGSWNAAIVAEYVKWGDQKVTAHGIGAYIAQATEAGDYPRIVLGVVIMSLFVILLNRLFWRPLLGLAEKRLRIS